MVKKTRPSRVGLVIGSLMLSLGLVGCSAAVADVQGDDVVLKFSDFLPPTHYGQVEGIDPFMAEVEERSGGSITFEHFPSAQLVAAKDQVSAAGEGLVDISFFTNNYALEQLPLLSICSLPNAFETPRQGLEACAGVLQTEEFNRELDEENLHYMWGFVQQPYTISTAHNRVESINQLAGMKIQSSGGAFSETLQVAGVAPVEMSGGEIYEALDRKTVDGVNLNLMSISGYTLEPKIKYSYEGIDTGSPYNGFVMNADTWESLTPEQQKIITDVGQKAEAAMTKYLDEAFAETRQDFIEQGIEFIEFPESETDKWKATVQPVWDDWLPNMKSRGIDGRPAMEVWLNATDSFDA